MHAPANSPMIYRPLTESDINAYLALEGYAFSSNPDRSGLDAAKMAQFRGCFVDGALAAQLELLPLRMQTGAAEVPMVGIGSVAAAPEHRRQGHVAALLRHACAELREQGVAFSVLYPFSRPFYGRYGWATFMEHREYRGAPALFAPFRPCPPDQGRFHPAGVAQIAELDRIYRGALRGRFGPTVRDEAWWRHEILHDWEGRRRQAYIWRDATGQGRSYLIFQLVRVEGRQQLHCREIVALDPAARAQLFAFLAGHADQVAQIRFRAPADAPVNLLFPDPLECLAQPHFMLRLVDVAAAIGQYGFPRGTTGTLRIAVADDWIAENQAVYQIELSAGRAEVARLPAGAPADLSCDVRVLSQILSRYLRPRTAAAFGVLDAADRKALDLAEQAFAGLSPFSTDFF